MSRLPYAARTLIQQVEGLRPSAKHYEASEPDGLRVVREVKFDKRTSEWLAPLLDRIDDERIKEHYLTDAGYLHVEFVGGVEADERRKFPLREALRLAEADRESEEPSSDSELSEAPEGSPEEAPHQES